MVQVPPQHLVRSLKGAQEKLHQLESERKPFALTKSPVRRSIRLVRVGLEEHMWWAGKVVVSGPNVTCHY